MLCKHFKCEIFNKCEIFSWFFNSWKGYLTKREDERSKVQMFIRKILRHSKNLLTEKIFSGKKHHSMKELVVTLTMAICLKNAVLIILLPSRKVECLLTISCCQKNAVPRKRPLTTWNSFLTLTVAEKEKLMKSSPMYTTYCPLKETKRAICFSKSKRPILLDRQQARTPARISNFANTSNEERRV